MSLHIKALPALFCLLSATLLSVLPAAANTIDAASFSVQRKHYLEAREILRQNDPLKVRALDKALQGYPLYPYFLAMQIGMQKNMDKQAVDHFLLHYGDQPAARSLRQQWLQQLAKHAQWADYLAYYPPAANTGMRCNFHYAQLQKGDTQAAWQGARELWLVAQSQHSSCDPLFAAWEKAGGLNPELRRQRLKLALEAGNLSLASYIAKKLPSPDQQYTKLWEQAHHQPGTITRQEQLRKDLPKNRAVVLYALKKAIRRDVHEGIVLWERVAHAYSFTNDEQNGILNLITLHLALRGDANAHDWYKKISSRAITPNVQASMIRNALRRQDWQQGLSLLEALPADERGNEEWQYWEARLQQNLGNEVVTQQLLQKIASHSSYYGFLAADHLGSPYRIKHEPLQVDKESLLAIQQIPAIQRAHELMRIGQLATARQEWGLALHSLDSTGQLAAGKLADSWGWHDRAAITLARAKHFSDLEIRFPLAYNQLFMQEAKNNALDPAWVFAVARQESIMMQDALSPAGARGLMQLMPATGKQLARELKRGIKSINQLLQPDFNIHLGSYYLRQLNEKFSGHTALATAAYNAGPNRVRQWQPAENMEADIWIDTIPYRETRQYVRRVLAYSIFYDQRLGKPGVRLQQRMPPVYSDTTTAQN